MTNVNELLQDDPGIAEVRIQANKEGILVTFVECSAVDPVQGNTILFSERSDRRPKPLTYLGWVVLQALAPEGAEFAVRGDGVRAVIFSPKFADPASLVDAANALSVAVREAMRKKGLPPVRVTLQFA